MSETSSGPTQEETLPPGQVWGKRFVIYAALGVQHIDPAKWTLEVTGLVKTPLVFKYDEVLKLPMKSYEKDAYCVTKWSIKKPLWEGVPIELLVDNAQVNPNAKWVMFHCYDGYTAPVPIEDALAEDSIVALKLNGKPLSAEQGFPARPFIPHLYLWKSAKWLTKIEFIQDYADGYWEGFGYHERGNVYDEERFKSSSDHKAHARTAFGTA